MNLASYVAFLSSDGASVIAPVTGPRREVNIAFSGSRFLAESKTALKDAVDRYSSDNATSFRPIIKIFPNLHE